MFLDDNEQQQQLSDSFRYTPSYWTSEIFPKDEFNEKMVNMTKILRIDTPELTINGFNMDENKPSHEKSLVEQLKAQLIRNQMQRKQARDYPRILRQSNTPAYWYKTPSLIRSVYFYDPNYQKYIQQRSSSPQKTQSNDPPLSPKSMHNQGRLINHSNFSQQSSFLNTPRTNYMLDLYKTPIHPHQLKRHSYQHLHPPTPNVSQRFPSAQSRVSSIPILPPINISKQRNEHEYDLLNINGNHQPIIVELRKKLNPILMPPTS